jgi:hypothetical protein
MTTAQLAWLASLALGCSPAPELDTDDRPYARPSTAVAHTVEVRNSCPEAVLIAISAAAPEPSTPTMTLRSTRVETVSIEQGARVWLQYDGRFEEELSITPTGPVEVGYQCNSIYSSDGP